MLNRPLIPFLVSFIGGILTGHFAFPHRGAYLLTLLLLISVFCLVTLYVSFRSRISIFLVLFFLIGILVAPDKNKNSELLFLADGGDKVMIEGTVKEQTRVSEEIGRFVLGTDQVFVGGMRRRVREDLQVNIYQHVRLFSPGERIRFPATLRPFKNFNNAGRYNYEWNMRLRGISCAASVSDGRRIVLMGEGRLGFPLDLLEDARRSIRHLFQENLSPRDEALFQALILGERQGIGQELRESFNRAGLGHVLAVSGLHIGLVAWLAFTIIKGLLSLSYRLTLTTDIRKEAALATILPVIVYACLAGPHVSSQRAMIMVLAYLFSIIIGREKEVWSTFSMAALVVLAVNPSALFTISFQLSFCAVIGILWLAPMLYKMIPIPSMETGVRHPVIQHLYNYVVGLFVVTLSAVIFLLPITAFYFHRISLVSIPANLTVVPILGLWIIPAGLLAAVSQTIPFLAPFFLGLGAWGLDVMMAVIHFWGHFSWSAFWVVTPTPMEGLLFYALLLVVILMNQKRWKAIGLCLILLLLTGDLSYWVYRTRFNPFLTVTFLDVGQGNAAFIQFPGKERMLIDGGGFHRETFDVGEMVVAPFLFRSKIRRIDYLVLTHPQSDHMNGLHFIASHFKPKEFWHNGDKGESRSYKKLMEILDDKKVKKLTPADWNGERNISGVKVEWLHPWPDRDGSLPSQKALGINDNSLVLKLTYGGKSFLFPGDLEKAGEDLLMSNMGSRLQSDILLAPHHGGSSSSSRAFLDRVKPEICVISSGRGNPFGLPHPETLQRFNDAGCRTIRIDQMGAVQISVGPNRFKIRTFLGGEMAESMGILHEIN